MIPQGDGYIAIIYLYTFKCILNKYICKSCTYYIAPKTSKIMHLYTPKKVSYQTIYIGFCVPCNRFLNESGIYTFK